MKNSPGKLPPELQDDLAALTNSWADTELAPWLERLPEQFIAGMSVTRYGDLPRWREALTALPDLRAGTVALGASRVGATGVVNNAEREQLATTLQLLHPWRKGPFELFDLHIDTEWRSDWKWSRLESGLEDLRGRRVLDVGCGNGYHAWRMLGAGAREVIGIDPTPLFVMQFKAIQHYLQQPGIHVLPVGIEGVPKRLRAFDTVFSMGVLYHRRSPVDHLTELRDCLRSDGQLVLETLIVEGDENTVLTPPGRYARMGNVWFLPSIPALCNWLRKVGLKNPQVINVDTTSLDEQRQTRWMRFHSLAQFLDPENRDLTVEGLPAPRRVILTANAP